MRSIDQISIHGAYVGVERAEQDAARARVLEDVGENDVEVLVALPVVLALVLAVLHRGIVERDRQINGRVEG